ncbi:MAG: hypothetical protein MUF21_08145 [Gemmatimonadaceae bacterium]|nr:hypothetical protein [Gemmatimonadaceae bacterium]
MSAAADMLAGPDVTAILKPLAVALDRRRAYGPAHPVAREAEEALRLRLGQHLGAQGYLSLQVARDSLLADGVAVGGAAGLARELAVRLHKRGVGAISFEGDISSVALHALLGHLSGEEQPALVAPPGEDDPAPQPWTHDGIVVAPLRYDHLVLGDAATRAVDHAVSACWLALARLAGFAPGNVALPSKDGGSPGPHGDDTTRDAATPRTLRGIADDGTAPVGLGQLVTTLHATEFDRERARDAARALGSLADAAVGAAPEARAAVAEGLHDVLQKLGPGTFGAIVRALDEDQDRRRLLERLADTLPVQVVGEWLKVAAEATEQDLSHHLLRLLGKLSRTDGTIPRDFAESALRDTARTLVADWSLENPNPLEHMTLLERIAAHEYRGGGALVAATADADRVSPGDPGKVEVARIVALALELDLDTPGVHEAARSMVDRGELTKLLGFLRSATGLRTAAAIRAEILSTGTIQRVLLGDEVDLAVADALVSSMGAESVELLVDVLGQARLRAVRRLVLARLRALGPALVPIIEPMLAEAPHYLLRNLFMLLRDLGAASGPAVQAALRRQDDTSEAVRAEALRFLVGIEAARPTAILRALRDDAPRVMRTALGAVIDHAAVLRHGGEDGHDVSTLVDALLRLATQKGLDDRARAGVVLASGAIGGTRVRDWLATLLVRRTAILRRKVLVKPTPMAVAALHVLRRSWRNDPSVRELLERAQRDARDPRWVAIPALPTEEDRP